MSQYNRSGFACYLMTAYGVTCSCHYSLAAISTVLSTVIPTALWLSSPILWLSYPRLVTVVLLPCDCHTLSLWLIPFPYECHTLSLWLPYPILWLPYPILWLPYPILWLSYLCLVTVIPSTNCIVITIPLSCHYHTPCLVTVIPAANGCHNHCLWL